MRELLHSGINDIDKNYEIISEKYLMNKGKTIDDYKTTLKNAN